MCIRDRKIADIYLGEHMTPLEEEEAPVENVAFEAVEVSGDVLNAYVGDYYSRELETTYRVKIKDGGLIAVHSRHPDITLNALGMDLFSASAWFFGETTFERNEAGDVSVMSVSSGRVTDLKFEKIK